MEDANKRLFKPFDLENLRIAGELVMCGWGDIGCKSITKLSNLDLRSEGGSVLGELKS